MGSEHVIARFEAERQALALMNHPNVARVFDAGTTETGRPFFVMEYVTGVPITEYGDRARLTNCRRLELLVDVCHAIHGASSGHPWVEPMADSSVRFEFHGDSGAYPDLLIPLQRLGRHTLDWS